MVIESIELDAFDFAVGQNPGTHHQRERCRACSAAAFRDVILKQANLFAGCKPVLEQRLQSFGKFLPSRWSRSGGTVVNALCGSG
jgi:hypothetical protein